MYTRVGGGRRKTVKNVNLIMLILNDIFPSLCFPVVLFPKPDVKMYYRIIRKLLFKTSLLSLGWHTLPRTANCVYCKLHEAIFL